MNLHARFEALPLRLRRAVWIWLGLAPLAAALPASGSEALGLLAHPGFWCGLLPLIALATQLAPGLLREIAAQRRTPRRIGTRRQARRRGRASQRTQLAA